MNFVGNRRAISTVITTVMMLTAVAVMGATLVAWSNGKLIVFESSLAKSAANMTNAINENFVIENISFCVACTFPFPNEAINVTLTNIGTLPVKVTQISINGTLVTTYLKSTSLPQNIMPKLSYTVVTQLPNNLSWKSKDVDTITVTTQRGSILTTQATPP